MSFIDIISGSTVQPAQVDYQSITLDLSKVMSWPFQFISNTQVTALYSEVTGMLGAGNTLTLPDATLVSVGATLVFSNIGSFSFTVLNNGGGSVQLITPGQVWYLILADNTTASGVWRAVIFGGSTAAPVASALAGLGLIALNNLLNTNTPTTTTNMVPVIDATSRAHLYVWNGGTATITLPLIATPQVGSGFFVSISNQSTTSGQLTIDTAGGALINGSATLLLDPNQAAQLVSDGTNWYTLAFGNPTSATGFPDGTVIAPGIAFTANPSTGFYRPLGGSIGATVNGTQITDTSSSAFTTTVPMVSVAGTVALPSYSSSSALNTGIYFPSSTSVGISSNGTQIVTVSGTNLTSTVPVISSPGTVLLPSYASSSSAATGMYFPTSTSIGFTTAGILRATISNTLFTTTVPHISTPGSVSVPSYASSGGTNTGIYFPSSTSIGLVTAGVALVTIDSSAAQTIKLAPRGVGAGQTTALSFMELATNGTNVTILKAADAIAADVTLTLPAALGPVANTPLVASSTGVTAFMGPLNDYRNLIIGGDFGTNPWQRGTTFTTVANNTYTADRWQYLKTGTMIHTITKSAAVPAATDSTPVFSNSLGLAITTGQAVIAAGDYSYITQSVEGFSMAQSWPNQLTVSFWVFATTPGIYCVALLNNPTQATRHYVVQEYTISSASTWQYVTVTFPALPAASSASFNFNGLCGVQLAFVLAAGTTFQTTQGVWASGATARFATANQVNGVTAGSTSFNITGVQLETGTVATQFGSLPPASVLVQCKRYWHQSYAMGIAAATATTNGARYIFAGTTASTATGNSYLMNIFFDSMNTAKQEVVTLYSTTGVSGQWKIQGAGAGESLVLATNIIDSAFQVGNNTGGNQTPTTGIASFGHFTVNCELV